MLLHVFIGHAMLTVTGQGGKKCFLFTKSFQFSNIFGMSGVNHSLEVLPKHVSQVEVRTGPYQMGYFIVDLVLGLGSLSCWTAQLLSSSWTYILLQNDLINLGSDFLSMNVSSPDPEAAKPHDVPPPRFSKELLTTFKHLWLHLSTEYFASSTGKTSRCSFAKVFSYIPPGPSKCWNFSSANILS